MKKTSATSDEEIISALILHGTIKETAQSLGMSQRAIYDRMAKNEFQVAYNGAKTDLIRKAVLSINQKLSEAIAVIAELMSDRSVNPTVRLQAAQSILSHAGKFSSRLMAEELETRELVRDKLASLFDE